MAILAAAAGLADILALRVSLLTNRFLVRDLGLADVRADVELPHHAVDNDFQMQLPHPGNDRLCRIWIRMDPERRVFLGQLIERNTHLFLIGFRLWLDRN